MKKCFEPCAGSSTLSSMWDLLKKTFYKWLGQNPFEHSAALAYFTLFSLAPTLILAIGVAGMIFGNQAAEGRIFYEIKNLIGAEGADMIQRLIESASFQRRDVLATLVGGALFLLGATAVFAQLKRSLNEMWSVRPDPAVSDIAYFFKTRLLALAMVVVFCFILLVSLVLTAILAAFGDWIALYLDVPAWTLGAMNLLLSTSLIAVLFAMIFKVLPDVHLYWKDVWVGAAVTALLFAGGKYLIALYIGNTGVASLYGAAGSLVVVMIWVYYSSLILFLGASFTQVYTAKRGRRVRPMKNAVHYKTEIYTEEPSKKEGGRS